MHSHDRTMLASFGFADPDKKSSLHDKACRYLCQPEKALLIAKLFDKQIVTCTKELYNEDDSHYSCKESDKTLTSCRTEPEFHITKGEGQYKTTIGFVDLMITTVFTRRRIERRYKQWDGKMVYEHRTTDAMHEIPEFSIAVEVKVNPIPVSDILRQLNLYREYLIGIVKCWALVTCYDLNQSEYDLLMHEGVRPIRLGMDFTEWCKVDQKAINVQEV